MRTNPAISLTPEQYLALERMAETEGEFCRCRWPAGRASAGGMT